MSEQLVNRLKEAILDVPDFPKPGIVFKDITPILEDPELYADTVGALHDRYVDQGITAVAAPESRGFLVGAPLAISLGVPLVLVRKPGKLPRATISQSYELEYGTDEVHIHADAVHEGDRVVIVDDLLATGGTAKAACELIERTGAAVAESAFMIELGGLEGRKKLGRRVFSLVRYA